MSILGLAKRDAYIAATLHNLATRRVRTLDLALDSVRETYLSCGSSDGKGNEGEDEKSDLRELHGGEEGKR